LKFDLDYESTDLIAFEVTVRQYLQDELDVELSDVKNIELSPGSIIAKITTSSSSVANLIELAA